mmetsp:Transcript_13881/g.21158  ORF Transcript_13881/g.21158 Transcript_13881/m.21158 type:complete len:242 (+) Transcript_13881:193-918(+)
MVGQSFSLLCIFIHHFCHHAFLSKGALTGSAHKGRPALEMCSFRGTLIIAFFFFRRTFVVRMLNQIVKAFQFVVLALFGLRIGIHQHPFPEHILGINQFHPCGNHVAHVAAAVRCGRIVVIIIILFFESGSPFRNPFQKGIPSLTGEWFVKGTAGTLSFQYGHHGLVIIIGIIRVFLGYETQLSPKQGPIDTIQTQQWQQVVLPQVVGGFIVFVIKSQFTTKDLLDLGLKQFNGRIHEFVN